MPKENFKKKSEKKTFAKDDMFPIEPGSVRGANEELAAVCIGPGIRHRHPPGAAMFQRKIFVFEFGAEN